MARPTRPKVDLAARWDPGLCRRATDWGEAWASSGLAVVADTGLAANTEIDAPARIVAAIAAGFAEARELDRFETLRHAAHHVGEVLVRVGDYRGPAAPNLVPERPELTLGAMVFFGGAVVFGTSARARLFRLRARHAETSTSVLGERSPLPVDVGHAECEAGDLYLLCTDGLWGAVPIDVLTSVLRLEEDADFICGRLIRAAWRAGGLDGLAVAVARVG